MMVASDEGRDRRQVAILDMDGRTAAWTGTGASDWKGHRCGRDYCAQGNILVGPEVVDAMAASFEASNGPLAERLMDALDAAEAAGGDARGKQSGAILVVAPRAGSGGFSDRVVDIRVDDHARPLGELRRVLNLFRSGQMVRNANASMAQGQPGRSPGHRRRRARQVAGERQRMGGTGRRADADGTGRGCAGVAPPGSRVEPRSHAHTDPGPELRDSPRAPRFPAPGRGR